MRVQADRQLACNGRLRSLRGIDLSIENYLIWQLTVVPTAAAQA